MRYGTKDRARYAEQAVFARMQTVAADTAATERERKIASNMSLVLFVARRYMLARREGSPITDDLVQVGLEALVRAVDGFDETRGFQFTTYAYWSIWRAIKRELEHEDKSLNVVAQHEDGKALAECAAPNNLDRLQDIEHAKETVRRALYGMEPRVRRLLVKRHCEDRLLREIASEVGLSSERVRALVARGLVQARQTLANRDRRRKRIVRERAMAMA